MSWEIQYDENGDIYYLNQGTGEVSWEVPDDYNDPSWQSAPDPTPTSWEEDTTAGSAELPITAEAFEQTGDQTAVLTSAADTGTHVKFTTAPLNQEASANAAEIAAEIAAKDRRKWQYRRRWRKAYLHVTYKRYTELVKEYDDDAAFLNSELQPSTPGKPNKTPKRRQRPRTSNAPSTPGASSGTSSVAMSAADSSVATAASAAVADPSVSLDAVEKACARMGRLKYEEGEFAAASEWLTRACTLQPSNVRLLRECGMSFLRRFEEDGQHAHLNRSRDSLFRALMLRGSWVEDFVHLPAALMEMANLYELCGAFEGALEIMGKVTEFFPKFNKYSQVLHRSALVMMHISRFPGAAVGALLTRSIEFLDDLFEEKPVGDKLRPLGGRHALAAREDVLLLYARATASLADVCSSDVSQAAAMAVTEQKSDAAFGEAFSLRKGFEDADTLGHASWESWWVEPGTHQALANECLDAGEPTVAAYHFEELARLRKVQGRAGPEAGTASALADFHVSLSAAHCFFGFQDVAKGLRWAEKAYLLRLFDSGVRTLLSRWSASYAALFRSQEQAAMGVQHHWKKRAWSVGHYKLLREAQVSEWECSLQSGVPSQYWDPLTRAKLAYFRRGKWRGLFLFEDATAKRLQRWARNVKAMAGYHAALKEAHLKRLASSLQALRRKPYHLETREQCVQLSSHRRTPQHHKIKQCGFAFQQEHSSATKLQRQFLGLRARRRVHLLRSELASLALKRREGAALAIQCCVRCRWARGLVGVKRAEREELEDFAVKLQRLWTRKRGLWALGEQLKAQAHVDKVRAATLKVALWLQATHRRNVAATLVNLTWPHACGALQRVWRGYCWRLHRFRHFEANARVVQRAWRQRVERHRWLALLRRLRSDHARKGSSRGQALANPLSGWVTARLQQRRRWGRPDLATAHEGVPTPTPPPLQQLPPPILAPRHCLLSPSFPMNGEEEGGEEDGWVGGRCSWGEQLLPWLRLKVQTRLTSNDENQESDAQEGEEEVWALPPPLGGPYCPVGLPGSPAWPHSIRLTTLIFASEGYCSELAAGRELGEQDGKGGALFDFPQTGSSSFGTVDSLMLASLLRHQNCHLRTLVLIGADLSDPDSSRDLAAAVGDSKTLRKVVLAGCGMPRNTLTTLALTARAHNFNLKELIVDANPTEGDDDADESGVAEGEGGGEIGRAFQGLLVADFFATQYGRLETLSLCGMGLTDSDAVLLARGLAHSVGPSGTAGWRLNLKKKKNSGLAVALNDGGAASSSSSTTATTGGLRRLSLADNAIGDGGVLALAGALKERDAAHARQEVDADKEQRASEKALEEYLERTGGAVVGGGGPAVARPVVVRLWELDLSGNRVTEQGAKELLTYMLAANSPPPPLPPPQQQQQQQQQGESQKQTRRRSRQERYDEEYPGIVHTDENGMAAGMATMQRWNDDASASTATSVSTGIISSGSSTSSSSSSSHRRFSLKQQTLATSPSVVDAGGGGNSLPQEQPPSPREQKTSYKPCSLRRLNLARNLVKDGVVALACQVLRGAPWLLEVDLRLNMFRPHAEERLNQVVEKNAAAKRRLAKGASREEGCAAASSTINDEASASSSSFSSGVGNADGDDGTEVRQQRRRRPRDGKGFGDGADYCGNSSRMQDQRTTTAAAPTSPAAAASISGLVGGSQKEGNDCAWLFRPRLMQGFAPPPHSAHTAAAQSRSAVPLLAPDIQPVDIFRGAYSLDQPPTTVLSDSGVEVGGVKRQQRQPQRQQQQWRNLPLPSPDKYALTDVARVAQRLTLTHTPQQHHQQQQQHASASSMFAPSPTPKQQRGQRRRRTDASVSSPSFGGRTWLAAAGGRGGGGRRDEGGALSSSPASAEELLRLRYGLAQSASAKTRGGGQCTRRTTASSTPSTLFGSKHVFPVEHYQQQQQQKYENDDDYDADSAVTFLSLSVAGGGVGIQSVPNTSSSSSTSSLVAKESDRRRRVLSDPHHDQRHLGDHRDDDDDGDDDGSATVHSVTDPLSSSLLRLVSGHVSSPSSSSRQRGRRHGSGSNGHKVGSPGRREETENSPGGDIFETTKGEGRRKEAAPPRKRFGLSGML